MTLGSLMRHHLCVIDPISVPHSDVSPAGPKRIALLGAGWHSLAHHAPALRSAADHLSNRIVLAAVCDLDIDRARDCADRFGFERTYANLDSLLENDAIDALVAVTPIEATEAVASRVLPLRIPLLLEKPPGTDAAATRRLLDIADRHDSPHMVSLNRRFHPAVRRSLEWRIEQAPDRPPRMLLGRMVRHQRREPDFVRGTGVHLIDTALFLLGEPLLEAMESGPGAERLKTAPAARGTAGFASVSIPFAGGARADLHFTPTSGVVEETIDLFGDDFTIHIDVENAAVTAWDRGERVLSWNLPAGAPTDLRHGARAETDAFLDAVFHGSGFSPTLRDALPSMTIADSILSSIHSFVR